MLVLGLSWLLSFDSLTNGDPRCLTLCNIKHHLHHQQPSIINHKKITCQAARTFGRRKDQRFITILLLTCWTSHLSTRRRRHLINNFLRNALSTKNFANFTISLLPYDPTSLVLETPEPNRQEIIKRLLQRNTGKD